MKPIFKPGTPAEMYDRALYYARDKNLPPDYPRPHCTCDWPPENILLLEEFCEWLKEGGASPFTVRVIYLPMAGHVLGLALKPHTQLDLDTDLQLGLDFLYAKKLSDQWTTVCRCAIERFRRFLLHKRGKLVIQVKDNITYVDYQEGLPEWLIKELTFLQHIQQRNWRPARIEKAIRGFWYTHARIWRFLCVEHGVKELTDIRREYIQEFVDRHLQQGLSITTINTEVRTFRALMTFLQNQGYSVPQILLRSYSLKEPDPLPRFLSDDEVRILRNAIEDCVTQAGNLRIRRDALLVRAAFYLLWHCGLRVSEAEELRLEDLDLPNRKFTVRESKNLKDRTVYMTHTAVNMLQEYLDVRGTGPTDHVFLYRNQPIAKDLIRARIKAVGDRAGVNAQPHRLRHTAATQLLNAGCRITSIQKFLGHTQLSTTMIYARVHDKTVADDYFSAMERVERRLELLDSDISPVSSSDDRAELQNLLTQLKQPDLAFEHRITIVKKMDQLLLV